MNDAYNRIYRFHGRNDVDNLSIAEQGFSRPVPFHLSQMDQEITKDISMTPDSVINKDGNIKEQFSAPPARPKKSISKPLILPPPAIEARQIFRTSKNHTTANEKNIMKVPEEKTKKENKNSSEKQRIQNLRASYLLTPFSPMLTWSPSLPSKNTSIRTQFFLANKSAGILEQANESASNILPSIEKNDDQKINSAFKELKGQIAQDEETSIMQRNTSSLQDEFSLMLVEPASKTDKKNTDSNNDETYQNSAGEELSNAEGLPLYKEKNVNRISIKPFQLIKNGLKLDATTLQEDFIYLLQSGKDDVQLEILESFKDEGKSSGRSPLYYEKEYCIESDSLQNDYNAAEKAVSSLDEKFLLMLTESSSEERLYEESHLEQDEAFALLSGYYSEQEESSSEVKDHSTKEVFLEKKDESSFEYYHQETSTYSESQTAEECILEKKVSACDTESSSEDFILYKGEFSRMLEKAYAILEIIQTEEKQLESSHDDQPSTIQEIFSQLIDREFESYDNTNAEKDCSEGSLNKVSELLRSFSLMLNDTSDAEYRISEESLSLDENCCHADLESSSYPAELCSSETELDFNESSCNVPYDESVSIEKSSGPEESSINFDHNCDKSEESSPTQEETSSLEESPNLQDVFEHELLADEETIQEPSIEHDHECVPKIPMPTVKLPILVGKLDIEIDLFDIFPLHLPIKKITRLEWSIQSLDTHIVLPSNTIFIKGTLIADIEYVNPGEKTTLHSTKVPIKFDKTSEVCWLFLPDMPQAKTQNEFTFKSDGFNVLNSHYESSQYFTEKIESQLRCINVVWHNQLTDTEKSGLQVQGRALLKIDLLQEQYVDLGN